MGTSVPQGGREGGKGRKRKETFVLHSLMDGGGEGREEAERWRAER